MGRPLESYFHGDPMLKDASGENSPGNVYRLNRFLADDRIIASELVVKKGMAWYSTIVSSAVAKTDAPSNPADFINQRRRWLNGAFAATIYSLSMLHRL